MGGLEKEPSLDLKEFEDNAKDVANGDKGADEHDVVEFDPAKKMVGDGSLAQADAGKRDAEARAREAKEMEAKEVEKRMATLDANLNTAAPAEVAQNNVPKATPEKIEPVKTEDVAQNEIADEREKVAKISGALLSEGNDKAEA